MPPLPADGDASSSGVPWILVVGMHRSGTSAVTGALGGLGLALPPPGDLMVGYPGNPAHYESVSLSAFNERLLKDRGGTWSAPPPPSEPSGVVASRDQDMARAREAAFAVLDPQRPSVWKDPRLCLLLPFWRTALSGVLGALFVWRRPGEVAQSLAVRAGYTASHSIALWEWYNRQALSGLEGLPVFVTSYDAVLDDPARFSDRVSNWLSGSVGIDLAGGPANLRIDRAQRHNQDAPGSAVLLQEHLQLVSALSSLDGPYQSFAEPQLPPVSTWARDLLAARRDYERIEAVAARSETELARLGEAYTLLSEAIVKAQGRSNRQVTLPRLSEAERT